jgi:hypothetical protein
LIEEGFGQSFSVTVGVETDVKVATVSTSAKYSISKEYRKSVGKTFTKSFTDTTTTTTTV